MRYLFDLQELVSRSRSRPSATRRAGRGAAEKDAEEDERLPH